MRPKILKIIVHNTKIIKNYKNLPEIGVKKYEKKVEKVLSQNGCEKS